MAPQKGWRYTQKETGVEFRIGSLNALKSQVEKHRSAMNLDLSHGWWDRVLDQICSQNPNVKCQANRKAEGFEPHYATVGRALWLELHNKAKEPCEDFSQLRGWFEAWLQRVPQFAGCRCRENFIHIMHSLPPRFDHTFGQWAIDAHNAVNKALNKPQWPY